MTEEKEINDKEKTVTEMDDTELLKRLRRIRIANIWAVRIFFTVFFAVALVAMIIPLRPTYSENEKRELEKFPKFKLSALYSGKYFSGIEKWYSDTFPARDTLNDVNTYTTMLFGKTEVQIYGEVEQGDAIPSVEETVSEDGTVSENNSSDISGAESSVSEESETAVTSSESVSEPAPESAVSSATAEPESSVNDTAATTPPQSSSTETTAPTTQTLGALLINGDTAYEYYNFSQAAADTYVGAVNRAGALLQGKAQVYDLIIPTSMAITAPESLVAGVNTSDQKAAIDYMYSKLLEPVRAVHLFDMLKSRSGEYIYFRTDHHWTALGAYYSYCELMNTMGVAPTPLESYIKHEFPGFLGSFYRSSGKLPQLEANPDTVFAYQPPSTNEIAILSNEATWYYSNIIRDMSSVPASSKYMTFIKGDNAYSIINNPALSDGSACIVIKESFGNAFVPFLVPHYQNIYVVDYRYFSQLDSRGLLQLQTDTAAKDVIFINNISATRNKTLMGNIDAFVW